MSNPLDPVADVKVKARRDATSAREAAMQRAVESIRPEHLRLAMAALGIPMPRPAAAAVQPSVAKPSVDDQSAPSLAPENDPQEWLNQMARAGAPGVDDASARTDFAADAKADDDRADATARAIHAAATVNQLHQFLQGLGSAYPTGQGMIPTMGPQVNVPPTQDLVSRYPGSQGLPQTGAPSTQDTISRYPGGFTSSSPALDRL